MDDDPEIATLYCHVLIDRGHEVTLARTAEECLKIYSKSLQEVQVKKHLIRDVQPYEVVILDYKMPDRNGLEVAKEILTTNPHQRIIFVSAYVEDTLSDSIIELKIPVETLQKPVSNKTLIDTIEDREAYKQLERLKIDVESFKKAGFSHELLKKMLDIIKKRSISQK
jgi:CheY-like chemotaxis protein